jgi:hypothetical protein
MIIKNHPLPLDFRKGKFCSKASKKRFSILFKILFLLIIPSLDLNCQTLDAQVDSTFIADESMEALLQRMITIPFTVENRPLLDFKLGVSSLSFPSNEFSSKLAPAFDWNLSYGFVRITPEKLIPNRFYFANEFVFIRIISSAMKPSQFNISGLTTENWTAGAGYKNGYGYHFVDSSKLTLYHGGSLQWMRPTFDYYTNSQQEQQIINKYNKKDRFCISFQSGIFYEFMPIINFDVSYEHTLIFPKFNTAQWLGSAFFELLCQRTDDFFSYLIIKSNPDIGPVYNWTIKTTISLLFYELRRNNSFFPFKSEKPYNFDTFMFGFTCIF